MFCESVLYDYQYNHIKALSEICSLGCSIVYTKHLLTKLKKQITNNVELFKNLLVFANI